jgi:hypothetical protein
MKDVIEVDRQIMYDFIKDLAERGLRCDLTPTLQKMNDPQAVAMQMYEYLRRQDKWLRESAQKCIDSAEKSRAVSEVVNPVI